MRCYQQGRRLPLHGKCSIGKSAVSLGSIWKLPHQGIACGGGFEIVLGTDIIVMEEHARFALPEINVGVLADAGTIKLRRRIPYHVAVEMLMTGRWMDAVEAKRQAVIESERELAAPGAFPCPTARPRPPAVAASP